MRKMNNKGVLTVISGFSGAGKGTIMKALLKTYDRYALSISATTRKPRVGEEHGREYFFISRDEFESMIAEDRLLEYARYVDNYYGTPKAEVDRRIAQGRTVVLVIEVEGAENIRRLYPEATTVFLLPPSMEELEARLRGRGTETEEVIAGRMARAKEEIKQAPLYTTTLVNDEVDVCAEKLYQIIKERQQG